MKNSTIYILIIVISFLIFIGAIDLLLDVLNFLAKILNTTTNTISFFLLIIIIVIMGGFILKNVKKRKKNRN